jgi:hypothetical protein
MPVSSEKGAVGVRPFEADQELVTPGGRIADGQRTPPSRGSLESSELPVTPVSS